MSTAPQFEVEIPVRNLDVIDFLLKVCKWCGEIIIDSPAKPRMFCNNNNVCCNAYSRATHNRDRSIGFDGRYSGPKNGIRKQRLTGKDPVRSITENGEGVITLKNNTERERTSLDFDKVPVPSLPVGLKKPSKATVARMLAERKDHLPKPRAKRRAA